MPKLSHYKSEYQDYSKIGSDRSRIAAYAGLAIVWMFKASDTSGVSAIPDVLVMPMILFVGAIGLDLLQYFLGYFIWYLFFRYHEIRLVDKTSDPEVMGHVLFSWPIHACFILKFVVNVTAFVWLFIAVSGILFTK